jgi:hypothetical protein
MIQKQNKLEDEEKKMRGNEAPHLQELTGSPSSTSVSDVAKGGKPENISAEVIRTAEEIYDRRYGAGDGASEGICFMSDEDMSCSTDDIQEAYAKLFESLATIARV